MADILNEQTFSFILGATCPKSVCVGGGGGGSCPPAPPSTPLVPAIFVFEHNALLTLIQRRSDRKRWGKNSCAK